MRLALTTLVCGIAIGAAAAQSTKKGYVLVQADVTNAEQFAEYAKLTPAIVAKYDGRYLARGGRTRTLEGPPARGRVVLLEFPSFERAEQFFNSPEYVAAKKIRAGAATAQFVLVEAQ